MAECFTTSYVNDAMTGLLTSLVRAVDPAVAVEIGVQQGNSAIAIGRGMGPGALDVFDLFKEKYDLPPFANTYADEEIARANLQQFMQSGKTMCSVTVHKMSGVEAAALYEDGGCDFLHLDICNHYDNVKPILQLMVHCVRKMIVIEGGIENAWIRQLSFRPFLTMLRETWIAPYWNHVVIPFNTDVDKHNAITVLTRRQP